jgi:hypothetical protein
MDTVTGSYGLLPDEKNRVGWKITPLVLIVVSLAVAGISCGVTLAFVGTAGKAPSIPPSAPLVVPPVPPIYPERWTISARFVFTDLNGQPAGSGMYPSAVCN